MQPKEGTRTSTWVFSFNYLPDKKEKNSDCISSLPTFHLTQVQWEIHLLKSDLSSWPGANSSPRHAPPQVKGQEQLQAGRAWWQQSGSVAVILFSLLPQHSDSLLSVPLHHPPPFIKGSRKMGPEEAGTGGEQDWEARSRSNRRSRSSASIAQPGLGPLP